MATQVQILGSVGPSTSNDTTNGTPFRQGRTGEQIVSELHGRYYEQTYRGNIFSASSAAATSSAGLTTTYTGGVCVSNPAGSNKNLVILKASIACTVITAAVTTAGIAAGWSQAGVVTHTTPLVPYSNLLGSQVAPVAKADQAATLVNPTWLLPGIASSGIAAGCFAVTIDLEGEVIVGPGGWVATATSIASPATAIIASISWEEVAL